MQQKGRRKTKSHPCPPYVGRQSGAKKSVLKSLPVAAAVALALGTVCPGIPALAEETVTLDSITVKGESITAVSQPVTINVIDADTISELKLLRPGKVLEEVPGVEVHNYSMGGVANEITIRGFNNGAHGGDALSSLMAFP